MIRLSDRVSIKQYTKLGVPVALFTSVSDLEKHGYKYYFVKMCCEHKFRSAYGYVWRYSSDPPSFLKGYKPKRIDIARPVKCFSRDGKNLLRIYPSLTYAAMMIGGKEQGISRALAGKANTYYGHIWRYADERERRRGKFRKKEDTSGEEHKDED